MPSQTQIVSEQGGSDAAGPQLFDQAIQALDPIEELSRATADVLDSVAIRARHARHAQRVDDVVSEGVFRRRAAAVVALDGSTGP